MPAQRSSNSAFRSKIEFNELFSKEIKFGKHSGNSFSVQNQSTKLVHMKPLYIHPIFASSISRLEKIPHPYIHMFLAYPSGDIDGDLFGEGSSTDIQIALNNCIFETMERYFSTLYDEKDLTFGCYEDLKPEAVDVKELILMSDWEYANAKHKYVKFHDKLELHWHDCYEIRGDDLIPRLIPATLAILRYSWRNLKERFVPSLSAGTASGPTYADAILHGLYELIERDAFMITWLNRLSCTKIKIDQLDSPAMNESLHHIIADGFRVDFLNITTELNIPTVLCIISTGQTELSNINYMAFGLGSNLDPRKALARSYAESLEIMINYYDFQDSRKVRLRKKSISVPGFNLKNYFDKCTFLIKCTEEISINELPKVSLKTPNEELENCLKKLRSKEIKTYFTDLTPNELKNYEYRLVRVFASQLQPHLYEWDCWRLDNPRIFSSPVETGYFKTPLRKNELNLLQNPFTVLENLTSN